MTQDKMQSQRFELKYLLEEEKALELRDAISPRLPLDDSGIGKPNFSYRVNSIYLDSPKLYTFWDWANSNRNRFKLRMRFYDSGPETPVYLEIKRRLCHCILKQRCGVRKSAAPTVLAGQVPAPGEVLSQAPKHLFALQNFVTMTSLLQARPQALVTYLREAYVDPDRENLRVTFDRQVRIALCPSADFRLDRQPYVQPFGRRVILELKFTDRFPDWLRKVTEEHNLTRSAAAKYCEGIANLVHPEHANRQVQPVREPAVQ